MRLRPPEPLDASHQLSDFDSGVPVLDDWLERRALRNQEGGATRTFVVSDSDKVIGYHALASGGVMAEQATGRLRRKMPDPMPVGILARLAVDRSWHKRGVGRGLFRMLPIGCSTPQAPSAFAACWFTPSPMMRGPSGSLDDGPDVPLGRVAIMASACGAQYDRGPSVAARAASPAARGDFIEAAFEGKSVRQQVYLPRGYNCGDCCSGRGRECNRQRQVCLGGDSLGDDRRG